MEGDILFYPKQYSHGFYLMNINKYLFHRNIYLTLYSKLNDKIEFHVLNYISSSSEFYLWHRQNHKYIKSSSNSKIGFVFIISPLYIHDAQK